MKPPKTTDFSYFVTNMEGRIFLDCSLYSVCTSCYGERKSSAWPFTLFCDAVEWMRWNLKHLPWQGRCCFSVSFKKFIICYIKHHCQNVRWYVIAKLKTLLCLTPPMQAWHHTWPWRTIIIHTVFIFLFVTGEHILLFVHVSIQLSPPEVKVNCFHWSNMTVRGVSHTAAATVGINHVLKLFSDAGPWEHIDS